jgi:hypothetical protein
MSDEQAIYENDPLPQRVRKPFNGLSDAELERLAILAEEAAEVVQVVGKILRHGYESCHPHRPEQGTNRQHLEEEIGNFAHMVDRMIAKGDVDEGMILASSTEKARTIGQYLHHQ